ncbi:MAG: ABC transporter permease [Pirellulaceae bacterium]
MNRERRWCFWWGLTLLLVCASLLGVSADRRVLLLARNTLWVGCGACVVALPLGTVLALLVGRTDMPWRRGAMWLLTGLLFLPLYVHATAWEAGFGALGWYGVMRDALPTPLLQGSWAVIWIHGLWAVPWVTLIVAAALRCSESELEEVALLDATHGQVFWHVTLRRAWLGVMAACLWVLLVATSEIVVTDLYQVRTLAEELYTGWALANDANTTFGRFTAVVWTGMLTGAALMVLDRWLVAAEHVPRRGPLIFPLASWRWPATALTSVLLTLLVFVPVGNLAYQMGLVVHQVDGVPISGWSYRRFVELLVPLPWAYEYTALWEFRRAFGWTLALGVSSASLSVVVAAPLAWAGRRGGLRALPAVLAVAAGMGTMGPLVGIVLIRMFTWSDRGLAVWLYDRTLLAPVLAATWRCLPMAVLICWFAFGGLSRVLLDAARVDGAGPIQRFVWVGLAQRTAALAAAWLVSLAISCGELSATILVVPPGVTTIPIRVFGLLHAGVTNQAAAICLTGLVLFFLVAAVIQRLSQSVVRRGVGGD